MGLLSRLFGGYTSHDPALSGNPGWIDDGYDGHGRRVFRRRGKCEAKDRSGMCVGCIHKGDARKCTLQ